MKINRKALEEAEKTLNAFDGISNLEGNPFLYTRISASIEGGKLARGKKRIFSLRPIVIGFLLVVNILTGIFFIEANNSSVKQNKSIIESLKENYKITESYNEFISIN